MLGDTDEVERDSIHMPLQTSATTWGCCTALITVKAESA